MLIDQVRVQRGPSLPGILAQFGSAAQCKAALEKAHRVAESRSGDKGRLNVPRRIPRLLRVSASTTAPPEKLLRSAEAGG